MNFIKRNMPVIIIGGITLLIFIGIIVASQKSTSVGPNLQEVSQEELISEHTYIKGSPDARVTIVEFSDFQCPFCAQANTIMKKIIADYPGKIRLAYRHFPLQTHKNARSAAIAAQVAGEQGKFWEYHDMLFENQQSLEEEDLVRYASLLDLDVEKFQRDYKSGNFDSLIADDVRTGNNLGVTGTPTFYLNGKRLVLKSMADLERLVFDEISRLYPEEQVEQAPEATSTINTPAEDPNKSVTSNRPPIIFTYNDNGFSPKEAVGYIGQYVFWTNSTNRTIKINQTTPTFPELNDGFSLAPGQTFQFKLYKDKRWTFEEEQFKHFGAVYIN